MSVVGRAVILLAIEAGAIGVTPCIPARLGLASLDLTLARTFRVFRKVQEVIKVPAGQHIRMVPGETVLGITRQRHLPVHVAEAGGQREDCRPLRRPDGRLLLTIPGS